MRLITIEEQRKILETIINSEFWADMMKWDAVCYGGPLESYRDQNKYALAVMQAFPKDVLEAYQKELKKAEADKLRAKADELEKS